MIREASAKYGVDSVNDHGDCRLNPRLNRMR